jgi:CBS domain-containing protein
MAKNPRWCKPLQTWKGYFSQWMSNTEPKNLLEVSIFFDLRTVYGNAALTGELRQHLNMVSDGNGPFFYNLAENIMSFKSALGITGNIHAEKKEDKDYFNLKNALTPYIMFARAYALKHKISLTNTQSRIRALSDAQIITTESSKEISFGYDFMMQLRYRNQVEQIENEEDVNNVLVLQDLSEMEEVILKKVLGQSSELQNKLNIDFKGTVL